MGAHGFPWGVHVGAYQNKGPEPLHSISLKIEIFDFWFANCWTLKSGPQAILSVI